LEWCGSLLPSAPDKESRGRKLINIY